MFAARFALSVFLLGYFSCAMSAHAAPVARYAQQGEVDNTPCGDITAEVLSVLHVYAAAYGAGITVEESETSSAGTTLVTVSVSGPFPDFMPAQIYSAVRVMVSAFNGDCSLYETDTCLRRLDVRRGNTKCLEVWFIQDYTQASRPSLSFYPTPPLNAYEDLPLESLPPDEKETWPRERRRVSGKPKLALVIDDGGWSLEYGERILALDRRLTLAILPNTPFGEYLACRAQEEGFQVILHMPMENSPRHKPYPGMVKCGMTQEQMEALFLEAWRQVPGAVGVNNHTGSRFTADRQAMRNFLTAVKKKNVFFLDSGTTVHTVAFATAKEMGIPAARRDLFIDNSPNPAAIRARLREAAALARQRGAAIAIGHFRPNTVAVLEKELPQISAGGLELVPVSELLE